MPGPVATDREAIGELCRRYCVHSLVMFGSAVTEHFDHSRSDVDFLVKFADDPGIRWRHRHVWRWWSLQPIAAR